MSGGVLLLHGVVIAVLKTRKNSPVGSLDEHEEPVTHKSVWQTYIGRVGGAPVAAFKLVRMLTMLIYLALVVATTVRRGLTITNIAINLTTVSPLPQWSWLVCICSNKF